MIRTRMDAWTPKSNNSSTRIVPGPRPFLAASQDSLKVQMSGSSGSDGHSSIDSRELVEVSSRCKELRKEKDMLRETQPGSFELIRRLEAHVNTLSEAHVEDRKHIQKLERELKNSYQEIDFLQDQLDSRTVEINFLEEHVYTLKLKLEEMEKVQEMVNKLHEELENSNSERLLCMQQSDCEVEDLQNTTSSTKKLEDSTSYVALEAQFEIESLKLDLISLEQSCLEAKKYEEEIVKEDLSMNCLIQELEDQLQEAQKVNQYLGKENKELKEKLEATEIDARMFCRTVEDHLEGWLENKDELKFDNETVFDEREITLITSDDLSISGKVFGQFKLSTVAAVHEKLKCQMEMMARHRLNYELLVKQLKDELRVEKLRAKDEAEELVQEMAELRYQVTGLLERERKYRACVEQASLQRIAELEAQIEKEQKKPITAIKQLHYT